MNPILYIMYWLTIYENQLMCKSIIAEVVDEQWNENFLGEGGELQIRTSLESKNKITDTLYAHILSTYYKTVSA